MKLNKLFTATSAIVLLESGKTLSRSPEKGILWIQKILFPTIPPRASEKGEAIGLRARWSAARALGCIMYFVWLLLPNGRAQDYWPLARYTPNYAWVNDRTVEVRRITMCENVMCIIYRYTHTAFDTMLWVLLTCVLEHKSVKEIRYNEKPCDQRLGRWCKTTYELLAWQPPAYCY